MADSFRDLIAWQKGMTLAVDVYRVSATFPSSERYGLVDQLRRASVAIPSDVAEGKGRISKKEFIQMLARARGSSYEVQTQLELCHRLGYLDDSRYSSMIELAEEVSKIVHGLMRDLQRQVERERHPPEIDRS
jgi:four helix bundle protein